jgi:hypothetical protein
VVTTHVEVPTIDAIRANRARLDDLDPETFTKHITQT